MITIKRQEDKGAASDPFSLAAHGLSKLSDKKVPYIATYPENL